MKTAPRVTLYKKARRMVSKSSGKSNEAAMPDVKVQEEMLSAKIALWSKKPVDQPSRTLPL